MTKVVIETPDVVVVGEKIRDRIYINKVKETLILNGFVKKILVCGIDDIVKARDATSKFDIPVMFFMIPGNNRFIEVYTMENTENSIIKEFRDVFWGWVLFGIKTSNASDEAKNIAKLFED